MSGVLNLGAIEKKKQQESPFLSKLNNDPKISLSAMNTYKERNVLVTLPLEETSVFTLDYGVIWLQHI